MAATWNLVPKPALSLTVSSQRLVPSADPLASLVSLPSLDQILLLLWETRQGLVELQDLLGFLWVRLLQGISKVGLVFLIHIGLLLLDYSLGSRLRLSIPAHVCRSWSLGAVYCDPCSGCNEEMSQLISSCKSLASENESAKTVACPGPRKPEKAREKGRWWYWKNLYIYIYMSIYIYVYVCMCVYIYIYIQVLGSKRQAPKLRMHQAAQACNWLPHHRISSIRRLKYLLGNKGGLCSP